MEYAALTYSNANNLGDDIQTLAAMRFLPECRYFVDRDYIGLENRELKLIGNGYWDGVTFPPKGNIRMLPISMHIAKETIDLSWFRKNQPIGCRDTYTMGFLQRNGIEAYFSGCLTLTFPEYTGKRENRIMIVGKMSGWERLKFPKDAEIMRKDSVGQIRRADMSNIKKRLKQAEDWLDLYRTSRLVISRKVHAIFPCIAMGTPVIPLYTEGNEKRLRGYNLPTEKDIDFEKDYRIPRPEHLISELERAVNNFLNK